MILKETCPKCDKPALIKSEVKLGKKVLKVFMCGHSALETRNGTEAKNVSSDTSAGQLDSKKPTSTFHDIRVSDTSLSVFEDDLEVERMLSDGSPIYATSNPAFWSLDTTKKAYKFQQVGIQFAQETNYNCLIADAMGLGKTVQALISMKLAKKKTLILVKGSTLFQWIKEFKCWTNDAPLGIMPILDRNCIIKGFDTYIIGIDFIGAKGVLEKLQTLGIELLIIDECQNFKDPSSRRTKALITFIQNCKIKHKIALSGTPIKNRASEYFTILNLLAPQHFYSKHSFNQHWLIPNEKGIYTKLDPERVEAFRKLTSNWIIRREKQDVLQNLPELTRDYQDVEIEDELMKKSYNQEIDLFRNFIQTGEKINSTVMLGWLAKMRKLTGVAKIPWAIEWTEGFLADTEDSLAIGIHHHDVRDLLYMRFKDEKFIPLKYSGEDNIYRKRQVVEDFESGKNRLLIINMLAGGVGLNLQSCSNALVLERQWSSADEEQFEARFHRDGQKKPVTATYPIALGTIDQWFHDLVSKKREIVRDTLGDKYPYNLETDEEMLRDLVDKTLNNKL